MLSFPLLSLVFRPETSLRASFWHTCTLQVIRSALIFLRTTLAVCEVAYVFTGVLMAVTIGGIGSGFFSAGNVDSIGNSRDIKCRGSCSNTTGSIISSNGGSIGSIINSGNIKCRGSGSSTTGRINSGDIDNIVNTGNITCRGGGSSTTGSIIGSNSGDINGGSSCWHSCWGKGCGFSNIRIRVFILRCF